MIDFRKAYKYQTGLDAMLCLPCLTTLDAIVTSLPGIHQGDRPLLFDFAQSKDTWRGAHHREDNSFVTAVQKGCYMCYMLHQACPTELRRYAKVFRSFYEIKKQRENHFYLQFVIELHHSDPAITPTSQVIEHHGRFKILPQTDISDIKMSLKLPKHADTEGCGPQVHTWLDTCTSSHQACKEKHLTNIECRIRLLRVARDLKSRIHLQTFEKGTPHPKYVTMSHCWNQADQNSLATLREESIVEMHRQIQVESLPRKFRDAIAIARWLNVDYLWIDALCIIQNSTSNSDWQQQSAIMGDIYAGSYCNIAATNGEVDSGCFRDRQQDIVEPLTMQGISSAFPDVTYVVGYDDFWSNSLLDTKLHTRAWVLQERLLSPRTIHFGQEQIFWECRELKACEAYPTGIPKVFCNSRTDSWRQEFPNLKSEKPKASYVKWYNQIFSVVNTLLNPTADLKTPHSLFPRNIYGMWSEVVERYMQCDLSQSSDKLVAIAGIASKVKNITGENYLAGMWDNHSLPQELLWYVPVRRQADGRPSVKYPLLGESGYRAPSWSWASVDARIIWNWPVDSGNLLVNITGVGPAATVESIEVMNAARISLFGSLYPVTLQIANRNENGTPTEDGSYALIPRSTQSDSDLSTMTCGHSDIIDSVVYLDEPLSTLFAPRLHTRAYLLPICTKWRDKLNMLVAEVAGLIVQGHMLKSEEVYHRIGVFGLKDSGDLNNYMGGYFSKITATIDQQLGARPIALI